MAYLALALAILVTAILVYLIVHYHAKLRDKDDPKFLILIGVLLVVVADTWISFYGRNVQAFFSQYHFLLSIIPLVIYAVYLLFTHKHRKEREEKLRIKNAFQRYVIPDIIDEILEHPEKLKLGGEDKRLAILFSDIRGFTSISEKMTPRKLISMLNLYLSRMTQIILDKRGAVDKYIGDAIMAFWGAPIDEHKNSQRACLAAIAMQEDMQKLKKSGDWQEGRYPDIEAGIGINTGEVVVGNIGSDKRYDYTALGDQVNLASRLEGLTKTYGVGILISESTRKDLDDSFEVRELDTVMVKGKKNGVRIFELLTKAQMKNKKIFVKYEKALALYRKKKFMDAKRLFLQNGKDKASKLMANRCDELVNEKLPAKWDGSYEMKTK